jgi:hypothetical protein
LYQGRREGQQEERKFSSHWEENIKTWSGLKFPKFSKKEKKLPGDFRVILLFLLFLHLIPSWLYLSLSLYLLPLPSHVIRKFYHTPESHNFLEPSNPVPVGKEEKEKGIRREGGGGVV